ncbi:MAG: DUF4153 domain-containing protein [Synergistaceae bacterium]|jgi:hypothetical protein|nr:DUF4153 domain-containing protein [Synergistaceae bacterium]
MYGIDRKRYFWVGASALLQGLLLGLLGLSGHGAVSGLWQALPVSIIVIVPFALWLAQESWGGRLKRFLAALTAGLAVLHAYWLWSAMPEGADILSPLPTQHMSVVRLCAAVFLFLPFFQCRMATWNRRVSYSEVFFQLCRNVFLLFQAAIVTVVFWCLLLTASLLFEIIGLEVVPLVVFHQMIFFPLTSLTIAFSITLALRHPGIDSLGRWILAILAWLLPPFSVLFAVFVAALPFSGLKTLWDTGQASSLMLLLQFAAILLVNAAWLDGTRNPFPNRIVAACARFPLVCLPIYTFLCLYSLGLRVQQYGWSVDRIHAAFIAAVVGVWGLGYAVGVLLKQWPSVIRPVNTAAALIMAVLVLAMNSPLLDPYRLVADNQVDRLLNGQSDPESFDFLYLRFSLGRYGSQAIARLAESDSEEIRADALAAIAADADEYRARGGLVSEKRRAEIIAGAEVFPKGRTLPRRFVERLTKLWSTPEFSVLRGVRRSADISFIFEKLRAGGASDDIILVRPEGSLVLDEDANWLGAVKGRLDAAKLSGDVRTAEPEFLDLVVGGTRYRVEPF